MPSIMTLRTWPMVSPISAMRCARRSARPAMAERLGAHPFGAGARLARAAAAEDEPGVPGPAVASDERRQLVVAGHHQPVVTGCAAIPRGVRMPSGASSGWRDKLRNPLRNLSAEDVRLGCEGLGGCGSMLPAPPAAGSVSGAYSVLSWMVFLKVARRLTSSSLMPAGSASLSAASNRFCMRRSMIVRSRSRILRMRRLRARRACRMSLGSGAASRALARAARRAVGAGASQPSRLARLEMASRVTLKALPMAAKDGACDTQTARFRPLLGTELGDEAHDDDDFRWALRPILARLHMRNSRTVADIYIRSVALSNRNSLVECG